jgi:maleamate amidohydrolase
MAERSRNLRPCRNRSLRRAALLGIVLAAAFAAGCAAVDGPQTSSCTAALLVIDVQLYFLPESGLTADGGTIIPVVARVLESARAAGVPVIYTQHVAKQIGGDLLGFPDEVAPMPGDVVSPKTHLNAFQGTSLRTTLESYGVGLVVVCGLASEHCVNRTIGGAVACGFGVVVVEDAHSTMSSFDAWSMNRMWQWLGLRLVPSAELDFRALCAEGEPADSMP